MQVRIEVAPFGEIVYYKQLNETAEQRRSLETTWGEGVWLGHARGSSEALIGTAEGVVRAYTVKRKEETMRWDGSKIKNMKGTPARPNPGAPGSISLFRRTSRWRTQKEKQYQ